MSPDGPVLGELLRSARRAAGWTQAEVARALGIAQTAVSAMERGVYVADDATWDRLVACYDVDDEVAEEGRALIRASRGLRGAGAEGGDAGSWPPDPASCPRRAWCGAVRRHHGLTRAGLADRLGVGPKAIATLESAEGAFPAALRPSPVLGALAQLGDTTELALRAAWQPDEVAGVEHLVGRSGREVVAAAETVDELLRWLLLTGVTQTEVADACGVSRPAVHQWLTGATAPAEGRLAGLAGFLGVTPTELDHLVAMPPRSGRQRG